MGTPMTQIDYDKQYQNYTRISTPTETIHKILWPFMAVPGSDYKNDKGNRRLKIRFVNPNMYGFNTIKDVSISSLNKLSVDDDYLPTCYGYGCMGQGFSTKINGNSTREYKIWKSMIARCYVNDPNQYQTYREQGVYVCHRWLCYEYFCRDLPYLPGYVEWYKNEIKYDLDKDTLQQNAFPKVYSPTTCMFIPATLNASMAQNTNKSGYTGVYHYSRLSGDRYTVVVNNICIGTYDSIIHAAAMYNHVADQMGLMTKRNDVPEISLYEIAAHRIKESNKDQWAINLFEEN